MTSLTVYAGTTISEIERIVCKTMGVPVTFLWEKTHERQYAEVRFMVYLVAYQYTDLMLTELAKRYKYHHSTIIHGRDTMENLITVDENLKSKYDTIIQKILK